MPNFQAWRPADQPRMLCVLYAILSFTEPSGGRRSRPTESRHTSTLLLLRYALPTGSDWFPNLHHLSFVASPQRASAFVMPCLWTLLCRWTLLCPKAAMSLGCAMSLDFALTSAYGYLISIYASHSHTLATRLFPALFLSRFNQHPFGRQTDTQSPAHPFSAPQVAS